MTADYEEIRTHEHAIAQVVPLLAAMRSVAEMAFRRAEERLSPLARYAELLDAQLAQLGASTEASFFGNASRLKTLLIVITSERGLCGAFNEHLFRSVVSDLRRRRAASEEIEIACFGSQGKRLFEEVKEPLVYWSGMPSLAVPSYADIEKAALEILDLMESRRCGWLVVTHNAPRRRFQYEVVSSQLFPFVSVIPSVPGESPPVKPAEDAEHLLTHLVTERVLIDLYRAVIQSAISEQLARVAAMKLATDNAQKVLAQLTAEANRARQLMETSALLEIMSGFEAASKREEG